MLKGAIIGFGQAAEKGHVPAWKENGSFSIVAVADESGERLELAGRIFPGVRTYGSLEELLRNERGLDFVDIATPPFLHARQALLSLQHHFHVLCEKPLALNLNDCESLRAQARSKNRAIFTVHNWKYAPLFLKAIELVESGAVGNVSHVELHTLRMRPSRDSGEDDWRTNREVSGGGILVDHGWHNFYLLQRLIRAEPKALSARPTALQHRAVEEEVLCTVEYPRCSAVLYMTWRAPHRSNWGIVYGSEGVLEMRDDIILLTRKGAAPQNFEFPQKLSAESIHPDWFKTMVKDFEAEISNPKIRYQNLDEAQLCLTLLTCLNQSQRLGGKTIPLPKRSVHVPAREKGAATGHSHD